MKRQSLPFPHAGREIPQKRFPFPMGEGKFFWIISRSGKWEENLFSSHKKSLILLFLIGKNSFFHDFFSCAKGNSKKSLPFSHVRREIEKKFFSHLFSFLRDHSVKNLSKKKISRSEQKNENNDIRFYLYFKECVK